jgi:hypothetical protein
MQESLDGKPTASRNRFATSLIGDHDLSVTTAPRDAVRVIGPWRR